MNDLEIKDYLNKIINSKVFSYSRTHKELLRYLTEATLKGETPKEFTIGVDVLHQNADDPSTSKVRVHIYKLRQKLAEYYRSEGVNDHIYFSIPKGSYSIAFKYKKNILKKNYFWLTVFGFIFLGMLNFIFLVSKKSDNTRLKRSSFWNELIRNNKETVIVAGDFFVFRDVKILDQLNRYWVVRDMGINSEDQLHQLMSSTDSLNLSDYQTTSVPTYMPRDALFSMQYIIPFLYENQIKYQIILSSDFSWGVYNDFNIIYVGAFKNLKELSLLTDKLNIKYNNETSSIAINEPEAHRTYSSVFDDAKNIDYALISKMPGSNNNVIYFFVSDNDIGCIESVKYFTQPDSLKIFEQMILKDAGFFKAIYKTEGILRTGVTFSLVDFMPIKDSTLINFWHY